jgi:hypothetical protein
MVDSSGRVISPTQWPLTTHDNTTYKHKKTNIHAPSGIRNRERALVDVSGVIPSRNLIVHSPSDVWAWSAMVMASWSPRFWDVVSPHLNQSINKSWYVTKHCHVVVCGRHGDCTDNKRCVTINLPVVGFWQLLYHMIMLPRRTVR